MAFDTRTTESGARAYLLGKRLLVLKMLPSHWRTNLVCRGANMKIKRNVTSQTNDIWNDELTISTVKLPGSLIVVRGTGGLSTLLELHILLQINKK